VDTLVSIESQAVAFCRVAPAIVPKLLARALGAFRLPRPVRLTRRRRARGTLVLAAAASLAVQVFIGCHFLFPPLTGCPRRGYEYRALQCAQYRIQARRTTRYRANDRSLSGSFRGFPRGWQKPPPPCPIRRSTPGPLPSPPTGSS